MEKQKLQILTKASCVIVRISAFAAAEGRSKILKDDPLLLIVKGL